ncbi:MAG: hypothetical protein QGF87_06335 [Woeseiaceae bacterium]|jgi:hypothetical protein|nr:hypothetical protein [Woeseiaceae bacterium]
MQEDLDRPFHLVIQRVPVQAASDGSVESASTQAIRSRRVMTRIEIAPA